jgi:hypothetical protein
VVRGKKHKNVAFFLDKKHRRTQSVGFFFSAISASPWLKSLK